MVRHSVRNRGSALVAVIFADRRETAYLRDYSQDGICLDGLRHVLAGDTLRLYCKGTFLQAEVRWVREQRAGLCFMADCPPAEKARFLAAVSRGQKPARAARIFGFSELA